VPYFDRKISRNIAPYYITSYGDKNCDFLAKNKEGDCKQPGHSRFFGNINFRFCSALLIRMLDKSIPR